MDRYISRPPGFWDAVKTDYDAGEKLIDIQERHGVTKGEFDHHRRQAGWELRNKAQVNREKLVGRIFRLINRHLEAMEKKMPGDPADAALLNQLVGSLGKLIRFESGAPKADKKHRHTAELQDIREKLVRRIEELKRI